MPVERSLRNIENLLSAWGAEEFGFHKRRDGHVEIYTVAFVYKGMPVKFEASPHAVMQAQLRVNPNTGQEYAFKRGKPQRCAMRCLYFHIKACLTSAEVGLVSFEDVFLSHFVMGGAMTIGEAVRPNLKQLVENPSGLLPDKMLRALPPGDRRKR